MDMNGIKAAALSVRTLSMDAIQKANSGHPGLPLGCAELGALLYGEILKHYSGDSKWPNRDRFVLSAGHGSMFLYSLLHLSGYKVSLDDIKNFRQLGSKTPGHPEYGHTDGVETTTGPLGQGIGNAVGLAIAETMIAGRFNTAKHAIVDHYTYAPRGRRLHDGGRRLRGSVPGRPPRPREAHRVLRLEPHHHRGFDEHRLHPRTSENASKPTAGRSSRATPTTSRESSRSRKRPRPRRQNPPSSS